MVLVPAGLMGFAFSIAKHLYAGFAEGTRGHLEYSLMEGRAVNLGFAPLIPVFFIAVLAICNGLLSLWVSAGVVPPLAKLRDAALRIGDGDLNFSLERAKDDELGEVTAAFETMRAKLLSALEKQLAEESSRKELVAHVSHDLRTPIAVIRGHAEGLRDGIASGEAMRTRYLDAILDRARELEGLIDVLFSYTKLDLEAAASNTVPMNLLPFLGELYESLGRSFPAAAIKLELGAEFVPEGPLAFADPELTRRAISNLVDNAVRHSGKSSVAITLKIRSMEERIELSVSDDGEGVSDCDLSRLFEPFFRCDRARGRGGSGLGLAIVKKSMEAQGGTARAERASEGGLGIILAFREAPKHG